MAFRKVHLFKRQEKLKKTLKIKIEMEKLKE